MAVTVVGSGTLTTVVGTTPQVLAAITAPGVYVSYVDLFPMANADVVELTINAMVLTGGTKRVVYFNSWSGVQTIGPIQVSPALANDLTDPGSLEFTLTHRLGSPINIPWKVLKIA